MVRYSQRAVKADDYRDRDELDEDESRVTRLRPLVGLYRKYCRADVN